MTDKKYLIIKYEDCFTNDFVVSGFLATTVEEWEQLKIKYHNCEFPNEAFFTSKDAITFETFEDYLSSLTISEISEDEFITLGRVFAIGELSPAGGFTYGLFITPQNHYDEDWLNFDMETIDYAESKEEGREGMESTQNNEHTKSGSDYSKGEDKET